MQTLSQRPKVKPLLRKGFTFGLLKFANLTRTDVKFTKQDAKKLPASSYCHAIDWKVANVLLAHQDSK